MSTFQSWCDHYGYDPESPEAHLDYERYCAELELFDAIFAGESS